ncbi:MAG: dihydroorotase [Desulfovibrio sp.]|jgi:dihydroorotase|nr:dihydroorotase [Desulfovibrio sp.]
MPDPHPPFCPPPLIIREALLCPPGGEIKPCDIFLREGIIAAVGPARSIDVPSEIQTLSATGLYLFPSFIDAHVHLREPGHEYKEDIASGLGAAAHGGFGTVLAMANTKPCNDAASVTRFMRERAELSWPHGPRLLPVGALTVGLAGTTLSPMGELARAGCVAFSNDGVPVANTEIFRRGMEYAAQWGKIVIDHCEDPFLTMDAHMNEGNMSGRLGVKGHPSVAEALHVARDILLAEYLDLPVHLAHISCRQSVELLWFARRKGIKVTAETCPHYLFLDETALDGYNANAKINPPLRSAEDVTALRKALANGLFDMLATDHAPHAAHEKEDTLDAAPSGVIGLETAVPLTFALVRDKEISLSAFLELWHYGPARVFHLPCVNFSPGDSADIFLFDPDQEWTVSRETLRSKSLNTPFLNSVMRGRVVAHWLGGHRVV